jgi:hypothetical protein
MDSQPKVLFYGNSLMLVGVQATFKGHARFEVIIIDQLAMERELLTFDPSIVVFNTGALDSNFLFASAAL